MIDKLNGESITTSCPSQSVNLTVMEEFERLPDGFTPIVFGYQELTLFGLGVHVLIVEKGDRSPLPLPELASPRLVARLRCTGNDNRCGVYSVDAGCSRLLRPRAYSLALG